MLRKVVIILGVQLVIIAGLMGAAALVIRQFDDSGRVPRAGGEIVPPPSQAGECFVDTRRGLELRDCARGHDGQVLAVTVAEPDDPTACASVTGPASGPVTAEAAVVTNDRSVTLCTWRPSTSGSSSTPSVPGAGPGSAEHPD